MRPKDLRSNLYFFKKGERIRNPHYTDIHKERDLKCSGGTRWLGRNRTYNILRFLFEKCCCLVWVTIHLRVKLQRKHHVQKLNPINFLGVSHKEQRQVTHLFMGKIRLCLYNTERGKVWTQLSWFLNLHSYGYRPMPWRISESATE